MTPCLNCPFSQGSSEDLPAVSPPGVCRKISWHESMSDLSSKEKLPPIGSTMFNEEDEERCDAEVTTSDETTEPQVFYPKTFLV